MKHERYEEAGCTGLPDWGPEGARRCYACEEPVSEESRECILDYDDPLAAVLGKCEVCEAPRYEVLGNCPSCRGPVYELADHFACYNTFSGICDFRVPIARMEECELEPFYINMKHLLHGGLECADFNDPGECKTTHAILIRTDDGRWEIMVADGLLPDYCRAGERTSIGHSVGSCLVCGDSVIDLGDRFACSSASYDCDFSISKKSILDAVSSSIIQELHDAIIGADSILADNMGHLLDMGGRLEVCWHNSDLYEYYEMVLMKDGDGWTFKITRDDAELYALAKEEYLRMCSEDC